MFIRYSANQEGYKCYAPELRKVMVSRDVKFVESKGYYDEKSWENLRDLSHTTSDKEKIEDNLGISQPKPREEANGPPTQEVEHVEEEVHEIYGKWM